MRWSKVAALLLMVWPTFAQAMAITNLTDQPQPFEILVDGEYQPITLAPHATLRLLGQREVLMNDRVTIIEADHEYAIWPDGKLLLQRRKPPRGRHYN